MLPRQQLNGKYRIWMDEDVLQAIFVEYVGIQSCKYLSEHLKSFVRGDSKGNNVWRWDAGAALTESDELRRRYYLGKKTSSDRGINNTRRDNYNNYFLLSQLPANPQSFGSGSGSYDDDGEDAGDDDSPDGQLSIKQRLLRTLATEVIVHRSLYREVAVAQSDLQWYATGLPHTTIFAIMRFFGYPEKLIEFYRSRFCRRR